MTDDLAAKIQDLLGDAEIGPQLKGLIGGAGASGGLDIGALLGQLQANPDLLAKVQAALGDVDLGGALAGLTGGAIPGAGGIDLRGLGGSLGGMLGGDTKG